MVMPSRWAAGSISASASALRKIARRCARHRRVPTVLIARLAAGGVD